MRWRRVSGKFRMEDGWVDYKRRKKWAWEGNFWERKSWMLERILRDWKKVERKKKIKKRERILFSKREPWRWWKFKSRCYHQQFLYRSTRVTSSSPSFEPQSWSIRWHEIRIRQSNLLNQVTILTIKIFENFLAQIN